MTKTSQLLTEAADMIHDFMLGKPANPPRAGDWRSFVYELHERARAFKDIEDTP